jgi:hypothetical protein
MSRSHAENRVFAIALLVSILIHLSMVTLFRIVIYFPRIDIPYYDFRIVQARATPVDSQVYREVLSIPTADEAFDRLTAETEPSEPPISGLPPIELPTVRFAEMDLLRLERQSLETRSRYNELFDQPRDTWSQFGQQLSSVRHRLFGEGDLSAPPAQVPVSQPAPGFAAYLEWMNEPRDRKPLSVSRIDALWGLSPDALPGSVALVFRVNREGKVTFVQAPLEDEAGIVDSAAAALLKYRFEPLPSSAPTTQTGTFIIRAAEDTL